ncbi:MAG: MFS transporter [Brachybacterium sp.]|nr:MFS transporter [Brachybacterium sp.]MDN5899472.1 MFS transporter [Brachybacterium sp.]
MNQPLRSALPGRALVSNASDAAGYQLSSTALSVIVVTVLGFSATQVGLLNALGTMSFLFLVVPIGALVDRIGALQILVLSLLLKSALALVTLMLVVLGLLNAVTAMIVVTVMGVAVVASENAQVAATPLLTSSQARIADLVARMTAADRIAGVVAPATAGALLALGGAAIPLALALVLFALALLAATSLVRLRTNSSAAGAETEEPSGPGTEQEPEGAPASKRGAIGHGFVLMVRDRTLLATTLLVMAGNIGLAIGDSVESILVLRLLDLGVLFYGLLGTIAALSGLAAAAVAPRVVRAFPVRTIFGVGAVVQSGVAALPLIALLVPAAGYVVMGAFSALWAITLTITNIAGGAYAAAAVEPSALGRTAAARRMLTMGAVPIAALGGGLLADFAGMIAPLIVWPAVTIAAAALFLLLGRRERTALGAAA